MGWAKYTEDDNEINADRMVMREKVTDFPYFKSSNVTSNCKKKSNKTAPIIKNKAEVKSCCNCGYQKISDKYIVCCDCGHKFVFTAFSQIEYSRNGWQDPKRCERCREVRRTRNPRRPSF